MVSFGLLKNWEIIKKRLSENKVEKYEKKGVKMRKILFRGVTVHNKRFIYGALAPDNCTIMERKWMYWKQTPVIPVTVSQYINIEDIDNEKIFENDIVWDVIDDKYYGPNGDEIDEQKYKEECAPKCEIKDDKYYDKDGNEDNDKYIDINDNMQLKVVGNSYRMS